jgi:hypothetical protein
MAGSTETVVLYPVAINPLMPELNPPLATLTDDIFLLGILLLDPCILLIYA